MTISNTAMDLALRPSLIVIMLLLVVLPAASCTRWALYALPLTSPSYDWVRTARKPVNILRITGFAAALFLATTLLANIGNEILGSDDFHYFLLILLLFLAMTPATLGVYYSLTPSSKIWPDVIRLHPEFAPDSSAIAIQKAARKIWFLSFTQTGIVTLSIAICAFRLSLYDATKDPSAFFTLLGLALAALLGIGFGSYALASAQNYAATLLLISRILWSSPPTSDGDFNQQSPSITDPLGSTRSDLHQLVRRIERMARGGAPRGMTFPVQRILQHGALRIGHFLQSSRSLDPAIPADVDSTIKGVSSILVGDCSAIFYKRFGVELGAFDDEGVPAPSKHSRVSRPGRIFASLTQHAEPTDKLLSMAIRTAALVLVVVLAVSGKIGIDKLLEALK